jgi:hypothetical protein
MISEKDYRFEVWSNDIFSLEEKWTTLNWAAQA